MDSISSQIRKSPLTQPVKGLSSNEAGPLIEDTRGRLWIGTLDRGLNIFDGHRFRFLTTTDGLSSNRILTLAADNNGDILAGTAAGLNRIRDGRVIAIHADRALLGNEPHFPGVTRTRHLFLSGRSAQCHLDGHR